MGVVISCNKHKLFYVPLSDCSHFSNSLQKKLQIFKAIILFNLLTGRVQRLLSIYILEIVALITCFHVWYSSLTGRTVNHQERPRIGNHQCMDERLEDNGVEMQEILTDGKPWICHHYSLAFISSDLHATELSIN